MTDRPRRKRPARKGTAAEAPASATAEAAAVAAAEAVPGAAGETPKGTTGATSVDAAAADAPGAGPSSCAGVPGPGDTPMQVELEMPERAGAVAAQDIAAAGRALAAGGCLAVRAGGVDRMSAAATIALVSAARSVTASGGRKVVHGPSAAFTDAFSDLGLFEALMSMEFAE